MKTISPILEGVKRKVQTSNLHDICHYILNNAPKISSEDSGDINATSQYLVSDDGTVIAKYNKGRNAVGFYRETGEVVKHLTHINSPADIEGVMFTIEETQEINLLETILPQGDILIVFDDEVVTLDNESVINYVNYYGSFDDVDKIIYTGLSRGNTENVMIDPDYIVEYTIEQNKLEYDNGYNNNSIQDFATKLFK